MIFINWLRSDFLGWIYSATKCIKNPTTFITLLGKNVNTNTKCSLPPYKKLQEIFDSCQDILNSPKVTLQLLTKLAGRMMSYGPKFGRIFLSELFQLISNQSIVLQLKLLDISLKGDTNSLNAFITPLALDFCDQSVATSVGDSTNAKLLNQLEFNRRIQTTTSNNLTLTFNTRKSLTSPEISEEIYHVPFKTPIQLDRIFRGWFTCLEHFTYILSDSNIYATFKEAFFITCDASEEGVGFHILLLYKNRPQDTEIVFQDFVAFPDSIRSFIFSSSEKFVHSSGVREIFGFFSALKQLFTITSTQAPVLLFSDNLEIVLSFSSFKNKHSLVLFFLKASLDLLHISNTPYEAIWKPRTTLSARSSDLASRLSNWNFNQFGLFSALQFFNLPPDTTFSVPWRPIDLIQWTSISCPERIHFFHNTASFIIVFIPPNFPKLQYQNIFSNLQRFNLNGLLVCPLLKNSNWFLSTFSTKRHLKIDFSSKFFKTSYLSDQSFTFKCGVFRL